MKAESSAYGTFAHAHVDDEFAPSGCDMAPESAFAAYTTRPSPKFNPSWWWNSIRGAEWFHLYLWMLKDLLWCPHCPMCHVSVVTPHQSAIPTVPGLKTRTRSALWRVLQRLHGPFFCFGDPFATAMVWKLGTTRRNSFGCSPTRGGCTASSLTGGSRISPRYSRNIKRRPAT
jgi:hypothetical protein